MAQTRDRLLAEGLRLFAERGFGAVRVGDIEEAVGLAPRRGAMYRHFDNKEMLLAAAVEAHLAAVADARSAFGRDAQEGSSSASAEEVGAFILAEMDRQRQITQVLERDGTRLATLRDRFRAEVSDAGYRTMVEILRGWLEAAASGPTKVEALDAVAVHLLGALINVRRSTWTLGRSPLGLDDRALIDGWSIVCDGAVRALGAATE